MSRWVCARGRQDADRRVALPPHDARAAGGADAQGRVAPRAAASRRGQA